MEIKLILAHTQSGIIGVNNNGKHSIPWRVPEDMQHFKNMTEGHCVIMGRTTFDAIGREGGLPARFNIVMTTDKTLLARSHPNHSEYRPLVRYESSYENALKAALILMEAFETVPNTVWVMGGAAIYKEALSKPVVNMMSKGTDNEITATLTGASVTHIDETLLREEVGEWVRLDKNVLKDIDRLIPHVVDEAPSLLHGDLVTYIQRSTKESLYH